MKIDSKHPLAARASSASVGPVMRCSQAPLFAPAPPKLIRVELTVPYPPSVNTIYAHRAIGTKVVKYKTPEHRNYSEALGNAVRVAQLRNPMMDALPLQHAVKLSVRLFRPQRRGDIDNRLKALLDSLNEIAWVDDEQIEELHAFRFDDKENPRAELVIEGEHHE